MLRRFDLQSVLSPRILLFFGHPKCELSLSRTNLSGEFNDLRQRKGEKVRCSDLAEVGIQTETRSTVAWRRLFLGRPTGSVIPLAWAHAEFVKLLSSRNLRSCFDGPRAVWERYKGEQRQARCASSGRMPGSAASPQGAHWWSHSPSGVVRYEVDGSHAIAEEDEPVCRSR